MVVINNIAVPSHEKTEHYDENVLWASQCYDYLYNHFGCNVAKVQSILPKIAKYYEIKPADVVRQWVKDYACLYL